MHIHRHSQAHRQSAAPVESPALIGAQRPVRRHAKELLLACFAVLGSLALLALPGCPANLENASAFDIANPNGGAPPAVAGASGSGGGGTTVPDPPACMLTVLTKSCAFLGCHKGPDSGAMLDLSAEDPKLLMSRLINVTATHDMATAPNGCVPGQKLIDPKNPDMSWLLLKLTKETDELNCGAKMPIGPGIEDTEIACIKQYIQDVAKAAGSGGM